MKLRHTTVTSNFFLPPPLHGNSRATLAKKNVDDDVDWLCRGLLGNLCHEWYVDERLKSTGWEMKGHRKEGKKECVYCLNITCVLNKENLHFGQYRDFFLFFLLSFYTTCLTILTEFFHLHICVYTWKMSNGGGICLVKNILNPGMQNLKYCFNTT